MNFLCDACDRKREHMSWHLSSQERRREPWTEAGWGGRRGTCCRNACSTLSDISLAQPIAGKVARRLPVGGLYKGHVCPIFVCVWNV